MTIQIIEEWWGGTAVQCSLPTISIDDEVISFFSQYGINRKVNGYNLSYNNGDGTTERVYRFNDPEVIAILKMAKGMTDE